MSKKRPLPVKAKRPMPAQEKERALDSQKSDEAKADKPKRPKLKLRFNS